VRHATEVGLAGKGDREVFEWAQSQRAVIITPVGSLKVGLPPRILMFEKS
jgi:hypothetical protein